MATSTRYTFPQSAFVSATKFNPQMFKQELKTALGEENIAIDRQGSDVTITVPGIGTPAMEASVEAVVAAHAGGVFKHPNQSKSAAEDVYGQDELVASTNAWETVYEYDSGPMQEGQYQMLWSVEHRISQEGQEDSEVRILVDYGGELKEVSCNAVQSDKYATFSSGILLDKYDGQTIKVTMQHRKTGNGNADSILRRARLVQLLQNRLIPVS